LDAGCIETINCEMQFVSALIQLMNIYDYQTLSRGD